MSQKNGERSSLVVGTRGSRLALWQAEWIQSRLQEIAPDVAVSIQRIRTTGDIISDVPLAKVGGKGLFVKEIEEALLRKEIDLAVHSMKDVPSILPDGLEIICVPEREDPRDALISREAQPLGKLSQGARIGTSSLRRQAQLLHFRKDFAIHMLRGNVDTRLRKLREGQFEGIILAAAGVRRMGWSGQVTEYLPPDVSLPAVGQGALGLEARWDDWFLKGLVQTLDHHTSRLAVAAERALLAELGGGCQVPIAGHAFIEGNMVTLHGLVASVDGLRVIRDCIQGPVTDADPLGRELAERLLRSGGQSILKEIYG